MFMLPIYNNFSKYNLPNQSHKNTTLLSSNLGGFPTTKFQINQPYHFQARRGMKEKAVFLVKNLLKRTLETFQGLEKKVIFNFNLIELLPANIFILY